MYCNLCDLKTGNMFVQAFDCLFVQKLFYYFGKEKTRLDIKEDEIRKNQIWVEECELSCYT